SQTWLFFFVASASSAAASTPSGGIRPRNERIIGAGHGVMLIFLFAPRQPAGGIVAVRDDIGPQRLIRIRRIEVAPLADIGQSLVERAAVEIREAAVVVGVGGLGIEPDRLVKIGDAAVEIALLCVRAAAVEVRKAANNRVRIDGLDLGSESD